MTCLTVKSSIQPIKRPTGTDDDKGGNDKADASLARTWNARKERGVQRNCHKTLPNRPGIAPFMTPPAPDCTCGAPEKAKVWPNGDRAAPRLRPSGRVAGPDGPQSAAPRISSAPAKIIVLF